MEAEYMDTRTYPEAVIRETLGFLTLTNRHFGGADVVVKTLESWRPRWHGPVTILDVGTGGADIPLAVAAWARARLLDVRITAIDLVPEIVKIARENVRNHLEIKVHRADLFDFATEGETFDYVTSSLFLHHVAAERLPQALQAMDRLALRGLVMSDLYRCTAGYWAVKSLGLLAGNHVVRHDAPLSVRKGFLPKELDLLAKRADLGYLRADVMPWFRLRLAGEKS